MDDNYLERFRNKTGSGATTIDQTDIIALSPSRTEIFIDRLDKAIPAIFINDVKEDREEATVYTYSGDGLRVGDYFTILDSTFLVYKEIKNITREGYISTFKSIACNVVVTYNNGNYYAYYKGPLRSVSSDEESLAQNFAIDSKGESVIMLPSGIITKRDEFFTIYGKGFRVTQFDYFTNPGISYYSAEEYTVIVKNKISENNNNEEPLIPNSFEYLMSGISYDIVTQDAYIVCNPAAEILSRTSTLVRVKIPFGISSISITYKVAGVNTTTVYEVRS